MKNISISILLMMFSLVAFAQFDIDYNSLNRQQKALSKTIKSEIDAQIRQQQAREAKQQAVEKYNNRISVEGQNRMDNYNNPDNYIDRSITNRGTSPITPNDRLDPQSQSRDMRSEPVHSENLNSKSLQMLREANGTNFLNVKGEMIVDPNARVHLFETPSLGKRQFGTANNNNVQYYCDNTEPITNKYLDKPIDLEKLLKTHFGQASGFNLDEISSIPPEDRTPDEQQALADFEAYRVKEMEQMNLDIERNIDNSEEKKEIDAAILALDSYGDDTEGWLGQTNYKKLDLESLFNDRVSLLAEEIKKCNNTKSETGFHADLYYNEVTDTYVISFRGTEFTEWSDVRTNSKILFNTVTGKNIKIEQYEMAMQIAEVINSLSKEAGANLNIEVVGHSLGGSLASIVGLGTGIEAKTFNAALVPDGFLKEKGLYDKVQNGDVQNITAYHTSSDILTNSQNAIGNPAIGIIHNIGNPATVTETAITIGADPITGRVVEGVMGHRMLPIVRSINDNNNEKKRDEWGRLRNAQYRLQRELRRAEIRQDY